MRRPVSGRPGLRRPVSRRPARPASASDASKSAVGARETAVTSAALWEPQSSDDDDNDAHAADDDPRGIGSSSSRARAAIERRLARRMALKEVALGRSTASKRAVAEHAPISGQSRLGMRPHTVLSSAERLGAPPLIAGVSAGPDAASDAGAAKLSGGSSGRKATASFAAAITLPVLSGCGTGGRGAGDCGTVAEGSATSRHDADAVRRFSGRPLGRAVLQRRVATARGLPRSGGVDMASGRGGAGGAASHGRVAVPALPESLLAAAGGWSGWS